MFVLVMLMFIGLGIGPVLNVAFANTVTTSVTTATDTGFYAADAGVEYAIQDLRAGLGSTCSTALPAPFTVPTTVDGPGITVILVSCVLVFPPGGTQLDTTSLLVATISSTVAATSTEKQFTATAVVAVNMLAPTRNTSVESWSSVVS
jgi:hypothetical protein